MFLFTCMICTKYVLYECIVNLDKVTAMEIILFCKIDLVCTNWNYGLSIIIKIELH